ncbi:MAG: VWA domain-containing protein, partial [Alphaproteobacteria bacterium]|nr:VWA domain-containing protein [Alphaproteobacteria bacterium]
MSDDKSRLPETPRSADVDAFLRDLQRAPAVRPGGGRGRLIFALDAT